MRSLLLMTIFALPLSAITLQEAEDQALESNVAIRLTQQDVEQNKYRHLQSVLSWLPEITYGSMYAKLQKQQHISHMQRQTHLISHQLVLTQPVFAANLFSDLKLSKIAKEGSIAGREMAVNDILFQVRTLYLDVLLSQKAVQVQKQVVSYMTTAYEDQLKNYKAGSGTTLSIIQSKSALSQEITKYYSTLKEASDARQQFVLTTHLDPTRIENLVLDDSIGIKDYPLLEQKLTEIKSVIRTDIAQPSSLDKPFDLFSEAEIQDWVLLARQNRPELKRSNILVKASQEKSRQSKVQYLPSFEIFVDYGYYQPINGQFFKQRNAVAGGIQCSWSLFDSFKREARVMEISALKKAALIAYQYEDEKVEMTIRNDMYQIEEALFAYLTASDNETLAKQALDETCTRLSSGTVVDADFQNATRLYAQSQLQRQQAEFTYLKSYFQLRHDAGIDSQVDPNCN